MDVDDDEEVMRQALLLSMGGGNTAADVPPVPPTTASAPVPPAASTFLDNDFVNQLLGSVEVDPNDPFIIAAREQVEAAKSEKKGNGEKKSDDK
jgi:hypothetical protein